MGQTQSINKLNFESVQNIINNNTIKGSFIIISTLDINDQECLIKNTLSSLLPPAKMSPSWSNL